MDQTPQQQLDDMHFKHIFWFIVGLCAYGMILTILLILIMPPQVAERIADTALVFWLSTAVSGGIGYLLGSSIQKGRVAGKPGETSAEISATITSNPTNEKAAD